MSKASTTRARPQGWPIATLMLAHFMAVALLAAAVVI